MTISWHCIIYEGKQWCEKIYDLWCKIWQSFLRDFFLYHDGSDSGGGGGDGGSISLLLSVLSLESMQNIILSWANSLENIIEICVFFSSYS